MMQFFKKTKREPENIKDVLDVLKELKISTDKIASDLEGLKKDSKKALQRVGIARFNPFKEIGGDQSFSVAVLDNSNNGFVITSLYGREANRVYAKPINDGTSYYSLSKEEKEALDKAMKQ